MEIDVRAFDGDSRAFSERPHEADLASWDATAATSTETPSSTVR